MYRMPADEDGGSERDRLILQHLPQVRLIARRIHERLPECISLDDLISTGIIGLIAAIDNFDAGLGVQLKTYAEHKIRGAILDSLRHLDWAPRDRRKKAKQIEAAIAKAEQRHHREPAEDEIAAELGLSLEEYQKWLNEIQGINLENLTYVSGDNEERDLLQFISDDQEKLPSRILERTELEALLAEAIEKMPKMERTVLSLYYHEELNLREIAEVVDMHLSRISQLKAQAILRLRTYMEKRMAAPRR
jgi:RNA polymerase sigma factor for flagellar operon FliA